jgi:hypothetical protein
MLGIARMMQPITHARPAWTGLSVACKPYFSISTLIQTSSRSLTSLKNSTLRKRENELLNEYQIFNEEWITRGCIEKVAKIRKQQISMMS